MLKNRVFYVLLLLVAVVLYIFTNTYYTLTLLILCVVLPLLSLVLMLFSRQGLDISLDLPGTADKDQVEFKYQFVNSSVFPVARLLFQVHLENQMTGSLKTRKISVTVGGRKTVSARLSFKGSNVGILLVSTKKIRVYDAFGLFAFQKASLPDQAVTVYPRLQDMLVHMERSIENSGDGSRYSPHRPGQDVSEIFALREYASGDEVRKIHWKLSSKIDRTMVRDFSRPLNYSMFLLMELTKGPEKVVDAVVEAYLSLSHGLLADGINHSLAWYDAGEDAFHTRELDSFEDFDMAAAQVLSSFSSEKSGIALDYYTASAYRNRQSILLYVTAEPDFDKIAEIEVSQTMRTVFIYEEEAQRQAAEQAIEVVAISVEQAAEGMPEIMV
ncbi:MAG: DUF58 domain-containing protein [Firmicutes bacterium]|nr:DUF58 domain-containing protein [Bacillota bacterium]